MRYVVPYTLKWNLMRWCMEILMVPRKRPNFC